MCAVVASAMLAATALTAVAHADDTTTAESESTAVFTKGVWAAYADKEGDGKYDDLYTYYIFEDEKTGHTSSPEHGTGLPFSIEQNGTSALFHFASADNNTPAKIAADKDGFYDVTLTGDDGVSVTFRFVLLPDEDPDTFDAAEEGEAFITKGVYASYIFNEDSGEYDRLDDYYVFTGETEGHTSGPVIGMGVPFGVEQNGTEAVFHFASADDNTPAEINVLGDSDFLITFTYESGDTVTSRFVRLGSADPDTFTGESAYYGNFESADEGLQLYDANYVFDRINSVPMDYCDTVLVINYAMPLLEGFDLEFSFTTSDKQFRTYEISYGSEINNDTIMIPVKDLLTAAGVNGKNIVSFALTDKNDRAIVTAGFAGEFSQAVKVNITGNSSVDSAKDEQNPATGVNDLFVVGTLAAFSCVTAIISRKRK